MTTEPIVFVGASIGHRHEHSSLCVIERQYEPKSNPYTWVKGASKPLKSGEKVDYETREDLKLVYRLTHLDRLPTPTTIPIVADEMVHLVAELMRKNDHLVIIGEITAVGLAGWRSVIERVDDLIHDQPTKSVEQRAIRVSNIMGTAGEGPGGVWNVPRVEVLVSAQKALDDRILKIQRKLRLAPTLITDLESLDPTRNRSPLPDADGRLAVNDDLSYGVGSILWAADQWVPKERHRKVELAHPYSAGELRRKREGIGTTLRTLRYIGEVLMRLPSHMTHARFHTKSEVGS